MNIENATPFQADWTLGLDPAGRQFVVMAVKASFTIPESDRDQPQPLEDQVPLVKADAFGGDPATTAPLYESDFAPVKPRCDVLLNGSAYAPGGRPVARTGVGLRVGDWSKKFEVVGPRVWLASMGGVTISPPLPFKQLPISYETAFGGIDKSTDPPRYFTDNHVGVGFHVNLKREAVDKKPLPYTQESGIDVQKPNGTYRPMALGPVGRAWGTRYKLAGTYDDAWRDNVAPFLPADFDPLYYQSAPPDQQVPHLSGGENVVLANLSPSGRASFRLPVVDLPIQFFLRDAPVHEARPAIDTLTIEPDQGRFTICWRASVEVKRDIFEVEDIVVGRMSRAWYHAREVGKPYAPTLGEAIELTRETRGELDEVPEDLPEEPAEDAPEEPEEGS